MELLDIIFLSLDIVLIFATFILAQIFNKKFKEYKEKSLLCVSMFAILAANITLRIILIVIFVLLFLTVCELAYKIHEYKTKPIVKAKTKVSVPVEIYTYEGQEKKPE